MSRALRVIEALNLRPVTTLAALHAETGVPKPTLVRLLRELIDAGYATQVSRRDGYALTERVLRLAAGVRDSDMLVHVARPLMEAFTREQRWQVSLATYDDGAMRVRATTRDISPYSRDPVTLNNRARLLRSALGRAYIAACSAEECALILARLRASELPDAALAVQLNWIGAMVEGVRQRGYAIFKRPADSHWSMALAVAAPGESEQPLAAIVAHWYHSVMREPQAAKTLLPALQELAQRIGAEFGAARETAARACWDETQHTEGRAAG